MSRVFALMLDEGLHLVEVDAPEPEPDEALIEVHRVGVCGTDLALMRGYADFRGVPGHEFVGEVIEAEMAPQWIGRRVVAEINVACGRCDRCRRGMPNHCSRRDVLGLRGRSGAFAQQIVVPVTNLHEVPAVLDDDAAAFAEPIAAAFRIVDQVQIDPSTRVAVWGDGRLGLLIAMVLDTHGCELTVVGRHARKLALLEHTGAALRTDDDVVRHDFDVVIDATGSAEGLATALAHVRPQGTLVVKSTVAEPMPIDVGRLVVDEIRLIGSRCGAFEPALDALASGAIDPRPLVDAVLPLARGTEAFEIASRRGALKVLVDPRRV